MRFSSLALLLLPALTVLAHTEEPEGLNLLDEVAELKIERSLGPHIDTDEQYAEFEALQALKARNPEAEPIQERAEGDSYEVGVSPNPAHGVLVARACAPGQTCPFKGGYCCPRRFDACCKGQKWCIKSRTQKCCPYRRARVHACAKRGACCVGFCCKRGYVCCKYVSSGAHFCGRGGCNTRSARQSLAEASSADE